MSLVISSMKGIERASVLIDTAGPIGSRSDAAEDRLGRGRAIGGVPLDDEQVDKIRYYVAAAIAGMKPENVTITDANGRFTSGPKRTAAAPTSDAYARAVRKAEQDLTTKVRECPFLYSRTSR